MLKPSNIEQLLRETGENKPEISELVRSRIDETLASLPAAHAHTQPEIETQPRARKRSRLRRAGFIAMASSLAAVTVFASGFVSPAMADSIKKIPLVGSLFSTIQADIGLQQAGKDGLVSQTNSTVSYQDVKLDVFETVYDGTRAAFLVRVNAPNLKDGKYDTGEDIIPLSSGISNVFFEVDGYQQTGGLFYSSAGETEPDVLVFENVFEKAGQGASLPDHFNAEVSISLEGIDHEFKLDVPFTKSTEDIVDFKPDAAHASNDQFTASVSNIHITPITTRISTSILVNGKKSLTLKEEEKLRKVGIALFDDQGRQLPALSGEGLYTDNRLDSDRLYGTTPGDTRYLVVRPFIIEDDFNEKVKERQFIEGMEMTIQLPTPASQH
ncbi:DUF4179 domain-containing protein [Paenibacillus hubeiensis]|uniref:DUF4179 domain-containing protein n=1 Tax=Paenibacillus hubeiensis TaxID=3077330 RepID=UPI0031BA08BC